MFKIDDVCILHVDGSLTECINKKTKEIINYMGVGGYIVINGNVHDTFSKSYKNKDYSNHHEEYAIIEGIKWARKIGVKNLIVKTDSFNSVNLFNNQKNRLNAIDKFFLVQFFSIELDFHKIQVVFHKRSHTDIAHILSKKYTNEIFTDLSLANIHSMKRKERNYLDLCAKDKNFEDNEKMKSNLKNDLKCILNYQQIPESKE